MMRGRPNTLQTGTASTHMGTSTMYDLAHAGTLVARGVSRRIVPRADVAGSG